MVSAIRLPSLISRGLPDGTISLRCFRSGGMASGLVSLALQARLRCQRNEAAIAAIRPRQALAWAFTAVRLPTIMETMVRVCLDMHINISVFWMVLAVVKIEPSLRSSSRSIGDDCEYAAARELQ